MCETIDEAKLGSTCATVFVVVIQKKKKCEVQYQNQAITGNAMPPYYKVEINKTEWEVPEKYQMLAPVGSGAYGQVW